MSLTRQEVFQALADGKEVELTNKLREDWISLVYGCYDALHTGCFNNYKWRIKPEPPKWYENIPSHGVLCWISDRNPELKINVACITKIEVGRSVDYIDRNDVKWGYATPLTNEEIKQFLRGE